METAKELMAATEPENVRIRLLGISVSNFGEKTIARKNRPGQLPLFED
jgi:DNA polymerase-4